jgi:hypothetical protein
MNLRLQIAASDENMANGDYVCTSLMKPFLLKYLAASFFFLQHKLPNHSLRRKEELIDVYSWFEVYFAAQPFEHGLFGKFTWHDCEDCKNDAVRDDNNRLFFFAESNILHAILNVEIVFFVFLHSNFIFFQKIRSGISISPAAKCGLRKQRCCWQSEEYAPAMAESI